MKVERTDLAIRADLAIVYFVVIAIIILFLNSVLNFFDEKNVIFSFAFFIIAASVGVVGALVTRSMELKKYIGKLDKNVNKMDDITGRALEVFKKSIITYEDLINIENSVEENGEIWVAISALKFENEELKEIIRSNFKKNIKYVYLLPKESDDFLTNKMKDLTNEWKIDCKLSDEDTSRLMKCLLVPKHFVYMTVLVYNVQYIRQSDSKNPTVVVKFPESDELTKKEYPFMFVVKDSSKDAWKIFVNAINDFIEGKTICSKYSKDDTIQYKSVEEFPLFEMQEKLK